MTMKSDDSFKIFVTEELMRDCDGITARAMFGGWGIYKYGIFFALIADGTLYFKVDDVTKAVFVHHGSKPFVYTGPRGKSMTMSYWELPQSVMEDPRILNMWVNRSYEIAVREKTKKRG